MWRIILIICFLIFVAGFVSLQVDSEKEIEIEEEQKFYQGPVPERCDEDYFRRYGITRGVIEE